MKYIDFVNLTIKKSIKGQKDLILFGQNIDAGSCLSGLTKDLSKENGILALNTINAENTLVGIGFGLMLNNISSLFFMKQQDFLLLGIDQIVNTYRILKQNNPTASFTIITPIVDIGYEGPQSCLNNLDDFCSIANVEGYSFTNEFDASQIISKYLVASGFRILGVSQRILREEMLSMDAISFDEECKYFQYLHGKDATIVCFNNAIQYVMKLNDVLKAKNLSISLFSVNTCLPFDYTEIISDIKRTNNLILIDDGKSVNKASDHFLTEVYRACNLQKAIIVKRKFEENQQHDMQDNFDINYQEILNELQT